MKIVTYNLHFANRVDTAVDVVRSEPDLADADVISLQEADGAAVDRFAAAFGLQSAWYPAALHYRTGRHFAPAVLSRWPIHGHSLLELPHTGLHGLRRFAVRARIAAPAGDLDVVAVHFGTMREILPRQQEAQARAVLDALADPKVPQIVAGDLNRRGLGAVFVGAGFDWVTRGVGLTHLLWSFDHVFARGLPSSGARSGSVRSALRASDHRAVWAHFAPG